MNRSISILFRAIPLVMGRSAWRSGSTSCPAADNAGHFVAGHVNIALTAICIALFTTAATIIRQLVHRYGEVWEVALPMLGYLVATRHDGLGRDGVRARGRAEARSSRVTSCSASGSSPRA